MRIQQSADRSTLPHPNGGELHNLGIELATQGEIQPVKTQFFLAAS